MSLSIQVPTVGQANSTEAVKVTNSLTNLSTWANGGIAGTDLSASANIAGTQLAAAANIAGTQLAAGAAIADTQLASPNNAVGRILMTNSLFLAGIINTGTSYVLLSPTGAVASGSNISSLNTALFAGDEAADYAVAGKTTNAKLRVTFACNAVTPGATFTFGVYPVASAAGTGGAITLTLGTVVAGSTVALTPTAGNPFTGQSSAFALPSTSSTLYLIGFTVGTNVSNGYLLLGRAALRVYNS